LERFRVEVESDAEVSAGHTVYLHVDGEIYDLPEISRDNHTFILSIRKDLRNKKVKWYVTIKGNEGHNKTATVFIRLSAEQKPE
jgi:hypothetical protein